MLWGVLVVVAAGVEELGVGIPCEVEAGAGCTCWLEYLIKSLR